MNIGPFFAHLFNLAKRDLIGFPGVTGLQRVLHLIPSVHQPASWESPQVADQQLFQQREEIAMVIDDSLARIKGISRHVLLILVGIGLIVSFTAHSQDATGSRSSSVLPPATVTLPLPAPVKKPNTPAPNRSPTDGGGTEAEVIPDFYKEPGINPNREYTNEHLGEHIDPFTGSLQLQFVDLVLPGNGGFDLKVQRSYSSNSINWLNPFYRSSLMGLGWTFHFGRIVKGMTTGVCVNDYPDSVMGNPVLELPDGSRQVLAFTGNLSPLMITASRWRADCDASGTGLVVYAPDGTQYAMNQAVMELGEFSWYATKITDRNGNYATITYANPGSPEITSVTTNDGRSLTFTYADSGLLSHRLISVTGAPGQTYEYFYLNIPNTTDQYYLFGMRRPDQAWGWIYLYNDLLPDLLPGSYHLKTINHAHGGVINYSYSYVNFDPIQTPGAPGQSVVVSGKSVKWSNTQTANWSYAYAPGTSGQYDITTVTGPYATTIYRHIGANYGAMGTVWMVGLLMEKQTGSSQTETYTWDKQKISHENNFRPGLFVTKVDPETYAPMMTSKLVSRDGATYQTTYSQFDTYGNPQVIEESGPNGGIRSKALTYYLDPAKWIIHQAQDELTSVPNPIMPGQTIQVNTILRTFDGNGNLTRLTQNGVATEHTYDAEGNITSTRFPRGLVHTYSDYKRGIPQLERQPEGIEIARTVSDAGNVTYERNGEGNVTQYSHDGLNRVTLITPPAGNSTAIEYRHPTASSPGNIVIGGLSKVATRGALQQTTYYEGFGRPLNVILGDTFYFYLYDALGRRYAVSNPGPLPDPNSTTPYTNQATLYAYDGLDRVTQITHQDGTQRTIAYGPGIQTVTDERGHATAYRYRAYGDPSQQFLIGVSAPDSAADVAITRNGVGLVTAVTQNGLTRTYDYDANYYLISMDHPETGTTYFERDAAGNMISRRVGLNPATLYAYDNQNRLYTVHYPGVNTPSVTNTYTKNNKLKTVSSSVATRTFVYDPNDNLTEEALTVDNTVFRASYAYNGNDQLTAITYPQSSQTISYSPNVLGRPTQVSTYVTTVDYWLSGQVKQLVYGNGVVTNYNQNVRLWPISFETKIRTPNFERTYTDSLYSYDNVGNLTAINDSDPNHQRALSYDALDRLTGMTGPWGTGRIVYTGSGDISSQLFGTARTTYAYDGQNRLSGISGAQTAAYHYDDYGNIISDSRYGYEYDKAPNLRCASASASVSTPCSSAANKIEYAYDGQNRRVTVTRSGVKTYEFYDAKNRLLMEFTPTQGNRLVQYYYLGNQRVAQQVSGQAALTVTKTGTGLGTVTSSPIGIDCGDDCSENYNLNTSITLTATPATGSKWVGWSPAHCGAAFSLTADTICTATFDLINQPPVVKGDLNGDGSIDQNDVNLLLKDRNKPVSQSVCGAPCDLDGDGMITALDARKLILLCTRPNCATP